MKSRWPILFDIGCLCDAHTDSALEFMAKAIGEDPPDNWEPHANPYIRALVEAWTSRGMLRFDNLRRELERWMLGRMGKPDLARIARPSPLMQRWSPAELDVVAHYLRALPREAFTLEDWGLLVDYVVQRYLPADDLRTEAEWFSTRASLMGRVQAALGDDGAGIADTVMQRLTPEFLASEPVARTFSGARSAAIEFGRARAAENVRALGEGARHKMRGLVVDHAEALLTGDRRVTAEDVSSKLLDAFGALNRDWRRIAVTEATEAAGQGFIASCTPGEKVKRVERYRGACAFCRSIDGRILTVVAPDAPDKDGDTQVWVGKTNVGRSASARKREGDRLVEREKRELYWIAAGAQHPNCRGSWVRVVEGVSEDPIFDAWLASLSGKPT